MPPVTDAGAMLATAQEVLKDVSAEEMLETAKIGMLKQMRKNPPPSFFEGMKKLGYDEPAARSMWDFCYAQGAFVEIDVAEIMTSGMT